MKLFHPTTKMNTVYGIVRRSLTLKSAVNSCCRLHRHHRQLPASNLFLLKSNLCTSFSTSAEETTIPPPSKDNQPKQYSEQIKSIVDQIANLTLVEVADLNQLLKERLNIQDAPVMAMGPVSAAPVEQEEEEEEAESKPKEKTSFTIKLIKFDDAQKVKLIKEIKALNAGMNLVQAKKFVESLPQTVKTDIGKDEAEKLKEQLEAVGGGCEIE